MNDAPEAETSIADPSVPSRFEPARHVVAEGEHEGEVDWYYRLALCFECGVVPTKEMRRVQNG